MNEKLFTDGDNLNDKLFTGGDNVVSKDGGDYDAEDNNTRHVHDIDDIFVSKIFFKHNDLLSQMTADKERLDEYPSSASSLE